jgi:hypothetical protein
MQKPSKPRPGARHDRVLATSLAVSLLVWAGAATANAAVDPGAAIHDATCPDH